MLDVAAKYESELQKLFSGISLDFKYKFFSTASWREKYESRTSTWDAHEFVSVHDGTILGYISYGINREINHVNGLAIISFSNDKYHFGKDACTAIDDIFTKSNFSKLKYSVVCGNPIESTYDKLTEKYGGRIVGVERDDVKLIDGKLYDHKIYELFREDYMKHRKF